MPPEILDSNGVGTTLKDLLSVVDYINEVLGDGTAEQRYSARLSSIKIKLLSTTKTYVISRIELVGKNLVLEIDPEF